MFFKINHFLICCCGLCIFSSRKLQIVDNYNHKMVIKFLFCMVSPLWTSRYVLICCTCLMHFLSCNLFVMSYLTLSAISANVLEIRLPSLSITLYGWLTPSQIACNPLLQRFPRMLSKFAWVTIQGHFCEDFCAFNPPLWATAWGLAAVLANFGNVLKTCVDFCRTRPPWFPNY